MITEEIPCCCHYCRMTYPDGLYWHGCTFQAKRIVLDPKKPGFGLQDAPHPAKLSVVVPVGGT